MRFVAFCTDYDGTLAHDGAVSGSTIAALEKLRKTGRRTLLVTGRDLADLKSVFQRLDLFDRVVAENGALLYRPESREELPLCEPADQRFIDALRARGVPLGPGRSIVATVEPYQGEVLEVIKEMGLELQVIFNKGAVMVLPAGVNKATGLATALDELGLSTHNAVAVGDAENDHAFLSACECGVAVANALPMLKERADFTTRGARGAGVEELIALLIEGDLGQPEIARKLTRHLVLLGADENKEEVRFDPYATRVLVAGPSGSGKTTAASALVERLLGACYQCCLVDPEGDYEGFAGLAPVGTPERAPSVDEVMQLLASPRTSLAVDLLGQPLRDRPQFFAQLLSRIQELRARTGRPHWIVLDEAHHLVPESWEMAGMVVPRELHGLLMVTLEAKLISPKLLEVLDYAVAVGDEPERTLAALPSPPKAPRKLGKSEGLLWRKDGGATAVLRLMPGKASHRRHRRKYATGDLAEDAFVFRGPQEKLKLRAHNLAQFLELAEGVDEETWQHHLEQHDYSRWLEKAVRDPELAEEARLIEDASVAPPDARRRLRAAIEKRYLLAEGVKSSSPSG